MINIWSHIWAPCHKQKNDRGGWEIGKPEKRGEYKQTAENEKMGKRERGRRRE